MTFTEQQPHQEAERNDMPPPERALSGVLLIAVAVGWTLSQTTNDTFLLSIQLGLAWFGGVLATYSSQRGVAGAGTLYLISLGLFHVGLLVAYSVAGEAALVGEGDNSWIAAGDLGNAARAVVLCIAAWTAGYLALRLASRRPVARHERSRELAIGTTRVGALVTAAGAVLVAKSFIESDLGLTSGYVQFLEARSTGYAYGILLLGLGCAFLIAGARPARRWGWIIFGSVVAILLPIGSRGAVLFPAIALLYVVGRRRRIGVVAGLAAVTAGLTVVSVLRQTRLEGVGGLLQGGWSLSPVGGLAEMGYSLYPVVVVQRWMATGTEPAHGMTLVAVPVRFVDRLLGLPVPEGAQDSRLLNVEIYERVGAIGGSPIAEGFRNGGLIGALLLMCAIGVAVAWADRQVGQLGILAGLAVFLPLLVDTRNSFAPVPAQVALGLALVGLVILLSPRGERRVDQQARPTMSETAQRSSLE